MVCLDGVEKCGKRGIMDNDAGFEVMSMFTKMIIVVSCGITLFGIGLLLGSTKGAHILCHFLE